MHFTMCANIQKNLWQTGLIITDKSEIMLLVLKEREKYF